MMELLNEVDRIMSSNHKTSYSFLLPLSTKSSDLPFERDGNGTLYRAVVRNR